MNSKTTGLVYVFTGDGKGKTSAALGVAMRAVGQGKKVAMIQWYKERRWNIGEHKLPLMLKRANEQTDKRTKKTIGSFEIFPMGEGFYKLPTDHARKIEHQKAAHEALQLAEKLLIQASKGPTLPGKVGPYQNRNENLFLLVLDEALNAVHDGLIGLIDLIDLISKRGETHIILTGRNVPKELVEIADLATEMRNIKHPYDMGKKAVPGLDY